jgi:hypothetical protein
MPSRTQFKTIKSYSTMQKATLAVEKLNSVYPDETFNIKKKTWPGKLKQKYVVRQVVKRGSKI